MQIFLLIKMILENVYCYNIIILVTSYEFSVIGSKQLCSHWFRESSICPFISSLVSLMEISIIVFEKVIKIYISGKALGVKNKTREM